MSLTQTVLQSRAVAALASPHGVDRYLELVNPMWAAHEVRAKVVSVERETSAGTPVATLTLQTTGTWAGHRAGQYVQLGVVVDGARRTRCFSVSSAESRRGDRITITLRANPDGLVSKHLVAAEPGTIVHLSQADGQFTLPEPAPNRLLFITGGSGITPAMSMVRTLLRRGYGGTVTFLHYAQSPQHQIFAGELADLPPNIHVHLVYGDLFDEDLLAELVPDFRDVDAWACGPAGMIALVQRAYRHSDKLRVEFFKPPSAVPAGSSGEGAQGDVTFARSGQGAANTGATLLEQAEAVGLKPEYGCRMGICFSCTSRKTEGTVRNVVTGVESSLPDEEIQICVTSPVGDCVVDL